MFLTHAHNILFPKFGLIGVLVNPVILPWRLTLLLYTAYKLGQICRDSVEIRAIFNSELFRGERKTSISHARKHIVNLSFIYY